MINRNRLEEQFAKLKEITAPGKGINRLAFTAEDREGRAYVKSLMVAAGLTVRQDAFGNLIGHYPGREDDLPAVMSGSHCDSVPQGGNYDGIVGILTAIEAVRSLHEQGKLPKHPLEIVAFQCEESSRFGAATLGSKAMRGMLGVDDLRRLKDKNGKTLYEVLQENDLEPEKIHEAKYDRPLKAYYEVHIEQGKVLESKQKRIGVVTGIAAPTRLKVLLAGHADHSGATPMGLRQDAMCAAAEIILAVEKLAAEYSGAPVVGTVGVVNNTPNVMNVIPGNVQLGIDIRSISEDAKAQVVKAVEGQILSICQKRKVQAEIEKISQDKPALMQPEVVEFLSEICEQQDVPYITMPSGAGHDAMHWTDYTATGMLFIPCRGGISHHPDEYAEMNDIVTAAELLEQALWLTANG
ncbi:N-carbamoyl-L-amino-acid hydrolase [Selenomonas sp. GACV-9]|uniref:Zn-dependent hydrolase n=1 Tax=Selenomonas sp. GACV-9 TaxID=3158782 RepID=UPI0008E1B084|nr:N-carbamoyl-L-amino-acid hydrolase [Selenomonas ruminantium]